MFNIALSTLPITPIFAALTLENMIRGAVGKLWTENERQSSLNLSTSNT